MRKLFLSGLVLSAMFLCLSLTSSSEALTVTYINPIYTSSNFHTLNIATNSLEFDSSGNIYAMNVIYAGSGTAEIERFNAPTFTTSSIFTSFPITTEAISGLEFDGFGNLYSSGSDVGGDSGKIYKTDLSTMATSDYYTLPDFRPTGIAADTSENVYFTGRLQSDPSFGNIYKLDSSLTLDILVADFGGRGIAVDSLGNLYASNKLDNSIYMFDALTLSPTLIATFDVAPAELTFDEYGNLYAFEKYVQTTDIIKIASVPEPGSFVLLGSGLTGMALLRKRTGKR